MFKLVSALSLVRDTLYRALNILTSSTDGGWSRGSAHKIQSVRLYDENTGLPGEMVRVVAGYCATQAVSEAIQRISKEAVEYALPVTLNQTGEDGKVLALFTEEGTNLFHDCCKVLALNLGWSANYYASSPITLVQGFNDASGRTAPEVTCLFRFGINLLDAKIFETIKVEPVAVETEPTESAEQDSTENPTA